MIIKKFKIKTSCNDTNTNWKELHDEFLYKNLKEMKMNKSIIEKTLVACEEIFVNISNYAYKNEKGSILVKMVYENNKLKVIFVDKGIKFDPTKYDDTDINKNFKEKKIGGLGIYIVKNVMDNVKYKYCSGNNILILTKKVII
ncbi:MAG: ATP-binding protein [Candidatus Paraimprobicoccus trichonymphae]|uniref:ATP-binding protein n=1 Tax=Candidatus Paraimprobicoccus trichonymphae TaxID=3033793 RepID=A0AA48I273_9FIRM|nr:MAG: ATP-binding protein [Candidatus Paraimprobicoccus trichonymphae]